MSLASMVLREVAEIMLSAACIPMVEADIVERAA
jgi:hypothetical protein